jgi:hypothetical protein
MAESEIGRKTRQQQQQKRRGRLSAHPKGGWGAVREVSQTACQQRSERGREESREMNAAPSPPAREWASHRERALVGQGVACAHAAAHRRRSAIRRSRRLLLTNLAILRVVSIGLTAVYIGNKGAQGRGKGVVRATCFLWKTASQYRQGSGG